jgi:hypothetical protein
MVILDFVRCLNYKSTFWKLNSAFVFRYKRGEEAVSLSVGPPGPDLRLAQPGGLTERLSVLFLPFYTWRWKQNPAFETL